MRVSIAAALAFTVTTMVPVSGQTEGPVRGFVGGEVLIATPTGEFAENVGTGFGLGIHGRYAMDALGILSLRADVGFINYGQETIRICVTNPCRVTGDLTTSNNIVFGGVGPELGIAGGPFRMYGNASAGFAYFGTRSSVEGSSNDGAPFASSTNFDDATFAWMAGGGVQLRTQAGRYPVLIDVGGRYHGNGEAQYLRKGDIIDRPDGSVLIDPQQSDTNLWTFRLGVSVGIPHAETAAEEDRWGPAAHRLRLRPVP